jgi:hypothetical protein
VPRPSTQMDTRSRQCRARCKATPSQRRC